MFKIAIAKYKDWLTDDNLTLLSGWARRGLTDEQIAHNIGIAPQTLSEWKKKYSDIAAALKKGKEVFDIIAENALMKRALGYTTTEIIEERMSDANQKRRHGGEGTLTEREWDLAVAFFAGKCCYCGDVMTTPTKDHVIPFSAGGRLSADNIVPCCQKCNSSKKDRDMVQWFKSQPFYSDDRLARIYDYLRFADDVSRQSDMGKLVVTKKITKDVPPDTTALIFWLKNRQPQYWRDRRGVDIDTGGTYNGGVVMLAPIDDNAANADAAGGAGQVDCVDGATDNVHGGGGNV